MESSASQSAQITAAPKLIGSRSVSDNVPPTRSLEIIRGYATAQ
jgi:hypothetical protein